MSALPPNSSIGIIGGGQLGRMSALAAARLGYRCHILSPEPDSPAAQVAAAHTLGDYEDPDTLRAFARAVDVITFEFENVSAAGLDLLASLRPVRPSPTVLRISQDRVVEKSFLAQAGVATAPWVEITSEEGLSVAPVPLPGVLKTTRLGYDGKGQAVLRTLADRAPAWASLAPRPLILEGFVPFVCELSVVVARGVDGAMAVFDVVENRHQDGILDTTLAPARIAPAVAAEAQAIARRVAEALALVGVLAVDACPVSQFEMHIRAVAGLPLPAGTRHSDAVMKNLVGDAVHHWPRIVATAGLCAHLYGKAEARAGRKMGHVTQLHPLGGLPDDAAICEALGWIR